MEFFTSTAEKTHRPESFLLRGVWTPHEDQPARAEALRDAALAAGLTERSADHFDIAPIARVHGPAYLHFLQNGPAEWSKTPGASKAIVPNVHPSGPPTHYPKSIGGRAGWHLNDCSAPVGPETFAAAVGAAEVALSAAAAIADGATGAYALCRPPGHHAFPDQGGGHCYLNNIAIAARFLQPTCPRLAILDIDVHHGNGTQGVFWRDPTVLTVSVHGHPDELYPFFWGAAGERGEGDGLGYNLNLPVPPGLGDEDWCATIARALDAIRSFGPEALLISLGLDAASRDPLGNLDVSASGFNAAGRLIGGTAWPVLLLQEGGYLSDDLGANLEAFLTGFQEARHG